VKSANVARRLAGERDQARILATLTPPCRTVEPMIPATTPGSRIVAMSAASWTPVHSSFG